MAGMTFEALTGVLAMKVEPWMKGIRDATSGLQDLSRKTDQTTKEMDGKVSSRFADLRKNIDTVVRGMRDVSGMVADVVKGVGTTAAAVAATTAATAVGMLRMGAAAEETSVKFRFLFKSSADAVGRSLDQFSGQVGRSTMMLRGMSSDFAAMLAPMGLSTEQMSKMSTTLTKLSVDMAAFFGVSESEAMSALQAGLAGQMRALRHYGIVIHEEDIANHALRIGIAKTADDVVGATRVMALYSLIMQQTGMIQGHAERTAGHFNNQLIRLTSNVKALSSAGGALLLPMASQSLVLLNALVAPIKKLASSIKEYAIANEEMLRQRTIEFWYAVAERVDKLVEAGSRVVGWFSFLPPLFSQAMSTMAPVVGLFDRLFSMLPQGARDFALVYGSLVGVWAVLSRFGALVSWIPGLGSIVSMLIGMVNPLKLLTGGWGMLRWGLALVMPLLKAIGVAIMGMSWPVTAVVAGIAALVAAIVYAYRTSEPFKRMVDTIAGAFWNLIATIAGGVGSGLVGVLTWCGEKLMWLGKLFADYFLPIITKVADFIGNTFFVVLGSLEKWWTRIGDSAKLVASLMQDAFTKSMNAIGSVVDAILGKLKGGWNSLGGVIGLVAEGMSKAFDATLSFVRRMVAATIRVLADAVEVALDKELAKEIRWMAGRVEKSPARVPGGGDEPAGGGAGAPAAPATSVAVASGGDEPSGSEGGAVDTAPAAPVPAGQHVPKPTPAAIKAYENEIKRVQSRYFENQRRMAMARAVIGFHETGEVMGEFLPPGMDDKTFRNAVPAQAARQSRNQAWDSLDKMVDAEDRMAVKLQDMFQILEGMRSGKMPVAAVPAGQGKGGTPVGSVGTGAGWFANFVAKVAKGPTETPAAGADIVGQADKLKNASYDEVKDLASQQNRAMRESMQKMQKSGAATRPELQELAALRQRAVEATAAIAEVFGKDREAAIEAAGAAQAAYKRAFEDIQARGKLTFQQLKDKQKDAAKAAKELANEEGKVADNVEKAGKATQKGGGAAGGSAAADARATNSAGAQMVSSLFGAAQQFTSLINNSIGSIGDAFSGMDVLNDAIAAATRPVEKIDLQIQNLQARMNMASINRGNTGDTSNSMLDDLNRQMTDLQKRRKAALVEEDNQRKQAEQARDQLYQRQQAQKAVDKMEQARETGIGLADALQVGARQPVVVHINGINDIQSAVEQMEKFLTRRGHHVGVKKKIRTY